MASLRSIKRSNTRGKLGLLLNESREDTELDGIDNKSSIIGETSIQRETETLSLSSCLPRNVGKLRKSNSQNGGEGSMDGRRFSIGGCLNLNIKGGGCRVGACEELDINCRRRSSALEDCIPHSMASVAEESRVQCLPDRFRKKNARKEKEIECQPLSSTLEFVLPDDVLEMIFVRLPLMSLMAARRVCRKWRYLASTPHFMQMRSEGSYQSPWLFLFGVTRGGYHTGVIHALDVSLDKWYRISDDVLKGRFLFSVASIGTDLCIVGGCSRLGDLSDTVDQGSLKRHKEVLVFSPLTGSWQKTAPMKTARSAPILGVFKVSSSCSILHGGPQRQERICLKTQLSRLGGVSDVYEDPHQFSLRRQLRDAFSENEDSLDKKSKPRKFTGQEKDDRLKLALIVVGGHGSWDEPLDTGEIYDPNADRWIEIARLPVELGTVCSGAVCKGKFYVYSEADKLASYDLERGFWVVVQTSHLPPRIQGYYPKLVSCKSKLFMLSVSWCDRDGQLNARETVVRKLWELDLGFHTWTVVSKHPDAPMDWNAAFVASRDKIYGIEMFRIFGQALDFLTACHVSDAAELKWSRITRKHVAHEADAFSCTKKSIVVLHL